MCSPRSSVTLCWRALIACVAVVALQGWLVNSVEASCGDWLADASMKQHETPASEQPHPSPCEQGNCHGVPHTPAPVTSTPTAQTIQEHWVCLLGSAPALSTQRSSRLVELILELPAGLVLPVERPPRHG